MTRPLPFLTRNLPSLLAVTMQRVVGLDLLAITSLKCAAPTTKTNRFHVLSLCMPVEAVLPDSVKVTSRKTTPKPNLRAVDVLVTGLVSLTAESTMTDWADVRLGMRLNMNPVSTCQLERKGELV